MSERALYVMLSSGEHEKIQLAAMTASVAAVSERPVEVFVSMNAINVFRREVDGDRYTGGDFATRMRAKGVPDALDLFRQGREFGSLQMYACSFALDLAALGIDDLVPDLFDGPAGLTRFLADAENGQLVVF